MHEEAAPITVYASAWKLLSLALVWTDAAAVLIWALKGGLVTAIFLLPVFGYGVTYAVYRLFVRAPVLVADWEGIYHNVLGVRPQRFAWAEIRSVGLYVHRPTPFGFPSIRYFVAFPKDRGVSGAADWYLALVTAMVHGLGACADNGPAAYLAGLR